MAAPAQKCRKGGVPSTGKHQFKKYFLAMKKLKIFLVKPRHKALESGLRLCGFLFACFKSFLENQLSSL